MNVKHARKHRFAPQRPAIPGPECAFDGDGAGCIPHPRRKTATRCMPLYFLRCRFGYRGLDGPVGGGPSPVGIEFRARAKSKGDEEESPRSRPFLFRPGLRDRPRLRSPVSSQQPLSPSGRAAPASAHASPQFVEPQPGLVGWSRCDFKAWAAQFPAGSGICPCDPHS
jgi:hypothetical protein